MCFDGPARTAAHEMWCTIATTTTSTVPMRPLTCFDGPAGTVAHEMWRTTVTTTTFVGVPGSSPAKNSYVCTMHFRQIASGVKYFGEQYYALCKCRVKALVPLWVYRRYSLPSRRRRQHGVIALVRPADGTVGATS